MKLIQYLRLSKGSKEAGPSGTGDTYYVPLYNKDDNDVVYEWHSGNFYKGKVRSSIESPSSHRVCRRNVKHNKKEENQM